jgi:NRPS condensation-like uncharacterized protein
VEPQSPAGETSATLQSRLEVAAEDPRGSAPDATIGDPVALLHHLDVSGRFHRDSRFGRLFHRGMVSLRENVAANSLHVSVDGNRVAGHVDRVSPLAVTDGPRSSYSVRRALAHNVAGMVQDLVWLLQGRQGDHRCELDCEWVPREEASRLGELDLLDPRTGAWSVQLEARVSGALEETRLRAALDVTLGGQALRRDCLEVVDCIDDDALEAARARLQGMVVPADARPPLRACLARQDAGDVLMLSLNHAASDGFGALQVLRSIARAYAGDDDPSLPLDFLTTSDLPVRPATRSTPAVARLYSRVIERLRNTLDRPARLAADEPGEQAGCGFHLVSLSTEETRRVAGAKRSRTNTNLLIAALHLAIADWNSRHGAGGRRIGVLVQADLRPPEWHADPVGNFTVTARMSTGRRDRSTPASALRTITAQIARNKRTRTGVALIAALERAGLLALWAKQSIVVLQPLTGNHLVDTTVLCNLGRLDDAPSFGPDAGETVELWFSTPARAPLSLCLGAVTIGGRLHLTFRHPHRLFGPDAARRFADCYLEHLRVVAGLHSQPPTTSADGK